MEYTDQLRPRTRYCPQSPPFMIACRCCIGSGPLPPFRIADVATLVRGPGRDHAAFGFSIQMLLLDVLSSRSTPDAFHRSILIPDEISISDACATKPLLITVRADKSSLESWGMKCALCARTNMTFSGCMMGLFWFSLVRLQLLTCVLYLLNGV